jgi:hypothetical protein
MARKGHGAPTDLPDRPRLSRLEYVLGQHLSRPADPVQARKVPESLGVFDTRRR